MKSILDSLKSVQTKKDIVTTIEYDCQSSAKEEEVFDLVWGILQNDLDSFSKITYVSKWKYRSTHKQQKCCFFVFCFCSLFLFLLSFFPSFSFLFLLLLSSFLFFLLLFSFGLFVLASSFFFTAF
jgi:hypothetical protein